MSGTTDESRQARRTRERKPTVSITPALFTKREAALYLGVSVKTLQRYVIDGLITPTLIRRKGKRAHWMFKKAELDRCIEASTVAR